MVAKPRWISPILLLLSAIGACAQQTQPATKGINPLLGKWETFTIAGKKLPAELNVIWTIDEKYITVTDKTGDQISRNPYTFSMDDSPHSFRMKIDGELDRLGWFEVKDHELRIVLTVNTGKAPTSWDKGLMVFHSISKSSRTTRPAGM